LRLCPGNNSPAYDLSELTGMLLKEEMEISTAMADTDEVI